MIEYFIRTGGPYMMGYKCYVNKKEILRAIKTHSCYDTWGNVEYGNDEQAVDYNICIDNSSEETEYCSAFYRLSKNKDGYWQHDGCQEWYKYEIDFSDDNWKEKLKEAAIDAYKTLWENLS